MHSNDSIYGIAGAIDKVDLCLVCDYDEFAIHNKFLSELFETIQDDYGVSGGKRVGCFGVEKRSGKRIYVFSTWGLASDYLLQILPTEYQPNVCRVDFRIESEIVSENFPAIKNRIEEHNPKRRNVRDYTTRKRNKEFGRDAGGKGICFGSHKSDLRLTMYKRTAEGGAIEVQVSGVKLEHIVSVASKMASEPHGSSFYAAICDRIIPVFGQLSKEMGFSEFSGLLAELGASQYNLSWSELVEQRMLDARTIWENLPQQAQLDFFKELQTTVISEYGKLA
jgi:hypothetical protein